MEVTPAVALAKAGVIPLEDKMSRESEKPIHFPKSEKIRCGFCKGTGKDPFGQLYPGSTCQVCKGRKEIYIQAPYKTCVYCHGSGAAFSMQNTCTVCNGRGVVSLETKKKGKSCSLCQGTGMELDTNLPCSHCRGLGTVVNP